MPNSPFTVAGITKDAFGNVVSGAVVTVSNDNRGGGESVSSTSDTSGEWSVNLSSLTTQWVDSDVLSIVVVRSGFNSTSRNYTIVVDDSTELNINQNFVMILTNPFRDPVHNSVMTFGQAMSKNRQAFWKGAEEYTMTASFVPQTGTDEYLEIPQNHVAYIAQIFIGTNGNTDPVHVKINKNSSEKGTGTSVQVGKEITISKAGPTPPKFVTPIRIPYNSDSAKSIVLSIKGGTTDKATVSIMGYILAENE